MKELINRLTSKQKKELDNLIEVIQTEADIVKQDYIENPSTESGSIIVIHQDSTLLDDTKENLSDIAYNITPKATGHPDNKRDKK